MPTRKRWSARAAAAAAAISLMTVTGLGVGQAHGTPTGGAIHSKSTTGVNGSSALNTHRALTQSPGEAAVGFAEMGPRPTAHGDEPEPPDGHKPEPPDGHKPVPPAARAALAKLVDRIGDYVAESGTTYTFGGYLDEATGRIVLGTDAPENVLSQLTDFSGEPESEVQAIRNMQVLRGTLDMNSRQADEPPFKGGAAIDYPLPRGLPFCSAGYTVQDEAEQRFMVTAGHCYEEDLTVFTPGAVLGTVSDRRPSLDAELIGGESYAGQIFTGGVDSDTTIPVFGAVDAEALTLEDYCVSGAITGESCGHTVLSNLGFGCNGFTGGCLFGLTAYAGGRLPVGGDSGAPFYSKVSGGAFIHGHHSSRLNLANVAPVGLAVPWTKVSDAYGVDIVTETE